MKHRLLLPLVAILTVLPVMSIRSQAPAPGTALPPDFVLFERTVGDYISDWYQFIYNVWPYNPPALPAATPLGDERVFHLQRVSLELPPPNVLQNYFVPDDAYLFFPVFAYETSVMDGGETNPQKLKDLSRAVLANVLVMGATIDGIEVPDMFQRRPPEASVFSIFIYDTNNFASVIYDRPVEGLIYPVVADGFFLMVAPLAPGTHDVQTRIQTGAPAFLDFQRHYLINSLRPPEFLAYQTGQLEVLLDRAVLPSLHTQPLLVSIRSAAASFSAGRISAGTHQLNNLLHKIRTQIAPDAPSAAAGLETEIARILARSARVAR